MAYLNASWYSVFQERAITALDRLVALNEGQISLLQREKVLLWESSGYYWQTLLSECHLALKLHIFVWTFRDSRRTVCVLRWIIIYEFLGWTSYKTTSYTHTNDIPKILSEISNNSSINSLIPPWHYLEFAIAFNGGLLLLLTCLY